jgi:hypothetical protein
MREKEYTCYGGPEGISIAMQKYLKMKATQAEKELGIANYRPSRWGRRATD